MNAINFTKLTELFKGLKSIIIDDAYVYLMNPHKADRLGLTADNANHYFIDVVFIYNTGDVKIKCDREVNNGVLLLHNRQSIEMPIWPNINKVKAINYIKGIL